MKLTKDELIDLHDRFVGPRDHERRELFRLALLGLEAEERIKQLEAERDAAQVRASIAERLVGIGES